jgi:hypothetical protein
MTIIDFHAIPQKVAYLKELRFLAQHILKFGE